MCCMELAPLFDPPYVAVIFTSVRTPDALNTGYGEMAARMLDLAADQPGYLGVESAPGVTISYWRDTASATAWRAVAEHRGAQRLGRTEWYSSYRLRVATVEREVGHDR